MLRPATREAMQLLMDGAVAMSRIQEAGIRIDQSYLTKAIQDVKERIDKDEAALREAEEWKVWAKHFGDRMSSGNPAQLGHVMFDVLGYKRNPLMVERGKGTDEDRIPNTEAAFEHLRLPFLKAYFSLKKLKKVLSTNLLGIQREMVNGIVHPSFHLGLMISYRSGCNGPNMQNQQVRNPEVSELVRRCVIPRKGNHLVEFDYATQEVRVAYFYNKDENLKYDILHGDMHTDRAMDIYMLTREELGDIHDKKQGKPIRHSSKNKFVFPQFYGSIAAQCAPDLWDAISFGDLKTSSGKSLFDHLAEHGIKSLGTCDYEQDAVPGTFEYHVKTVEHKMWTKSYPTYAKWKQDWWNLYQRQGGVNTLTGFRHEGLFARNDIINYPIQGSAFHCLLWTIIQVQREMIRLKMKARIICQIHDSVLADVPKDEVRVFTELMIKWGIHKIRKHWNWITIPLGYSVEVAESNWYEKTEVMAA